MKRRDMARANGTALKPIDSFRSGGRRRRKPKTRQQQQKRRQQPAGRPKTWAEHKAQTIAARRERALRMYGKPAPSAAVAASRRGGKGHKQRNGTTASKEASAYSKLPPVVDGSVETQVKIRSSASATRKVVWDSAPLYKAMPQEEYETRILGKQLTELSELSELPPVRKIPASLVVQQRSHVRHASNTSPLPGLTNARH